MDEYERQHVGAEGVTFRDKFPVPRWLLVLLLAAPLGIFAMLSGPANMPLLQAATIASAMTLFGFFGNLLFLGLRIAVSDAGLDVHVGVRRQHIEFADIAEMREAEFRIRDYPMGRGLVKWGPRGKAFIASWKQRQGVELTLKSGKHVFINTNDPRGLMQALRNRTAARVRVEASPEADSESLEIAAHARDVERSREA